MSQPTGAGVVFPNDGKSFEKRSTTERSKSVLAASLQSGGRQQAAQKLLKTKDWRFGYQPHVSSVVSAMADPAQTLNVAGGGLRAVHEGFSFHRVEDNGKEVEISVKDAMTEGRFTDSFKTGTLVGQSASATSLAASAPYRGQTYTGTALSKLAKVFTENAEAEPTFASSIEEIASSPTALAPPSDCVFVLIGATSEMGPCETLLKGGGTVIALARKAGRGGAKRWQELCEAAKSSPNGKLICPVGGAKQGGEEVSDFDPSDIGADALVHTPEIVNWLTDLFSNHPLCKGKRAMIYSGIYLDGGKFVRASVAMEMIIHGLTERLVRVSGAQVPGLLYIDTPSHVHLLRKDVADKPVGTSGYPLWLRSIGGLGLIKGQKKINVPEAPDYSVCDFTSIQQGPNYAVAKIIQRWRAIWSRHATEALFDAASHRPRQMVSITTGPPAKTESVMHSKTMAAMMNNIHLAPPNVGHEPETVRALLTLVMLRDLKSKKSLGNPETSLEHPMDFLVENAWHGGSWRCPYNLDSVGTYVVVWALYGKMIGLAALTLGGLGVYGGARIAGIL